MTNTLENFPLGPVKDAYVDQKYRDMTGCSGHHQSLLLLPILSFTYHAITTFTLEVNFSSGKCDQALIEETFNFW